jgi:transcriptional regulator GlxA family with amidase domain
MSLSPFPRHLPWRGLLRAFACLLAFLLVPLLVGVVNLGSKMTAAAAPVESHAYTGPLPSPTYDPTKRIAVIVVSAQGAEITDTLPTFEILARSGAFNVYVVAPERAVLPLFSSNSDAARELDVVPHFSFAGYDAAIGKDPDLIAIPYEGRVVLDGQEPDLGTWVRAHAGPGTTLLGICIGSSILADTGLVDGHAATTNTCCFDHSVQAHPSIRWVHDVRYVDDGSVITSTNLAAGVDATLHTVAKLVGRPVAEDVARQIGYTYTAYLDDPRFVAPPSANIIPLPLAEDAMFQVRQEQLGVLVSDGVGEFGLAALLDPYYSSYAARTYVIAPQRAPIVSRGGLVLLPRYDFATAPTLDRVVVTAGDPTAAREQAIAAWQQLQPDRPVQDIHREVGHGVSAYEATLRDLGRTHNGMAAAGVAQILFVPTDTLNLGDAAWPIEPLGLQLLLGLLGVGLVLLITRIHLRRRAPAPTYALAHGRPA